MPPTHAPARAPSSWKTVAVVASALATSMPARGWAHFRLDAPPSWMSQDSSGGPQKLGPCGDEPGGTATGIVTAFHAGDTITVKWTEIIPHDGWYRIALSYDGGTDLVDPPVVIASNGYSHDGGIEAPPVPPVLADGLFPHAAAGATGKQYSYVVKLPVQPCAKCTLQVIQFMNNHPSNLPNFPDGGINPDGYFYHHCATIAIAAPDGGGVGVDAGADASNDDAGVVVVDGASGGGRDAGEGTTSAGDGSAGGESSGSASSPSSSGSSGAPRDAASGGGDTSGGGTTGAPGSGGAGSSGRAQGSDEGGAGGSSGTEGGGCRFAGVGTVPSGDRLALFGAVFGIWGLRTVGRARRRCPRSKLSG